MQSVAFTFIQAREENNHDVEICCLFDAASGLATVHKLASDHTIMSILW